MPAETERDHQLEIGHVLFIDIVGYSKQLTNQQREQLQKLNQIVRETDQFRAAEAAGKLLRLPTGDGMALAYFTSPDAPVRCAAAISTELKKHPELKIRMGIHSGPVDPVFDVNDRPNVAGAGINMAQRVMDCGDAGHILLSKRAADDLAQYVEWKRQLHDLGEMEVKHGTRVGVVNFYNDEIGNPVAPEKLTRAKQERQAALKTAGRRKRRRIMIGLAALGIATALAAAGTWAWHRRIALASAYKAGTGVLMEKSIAVLPFENFDPDKESAYFADGIQDDILTDLAKVADLKVISRRSVSQYRGGTQSVRDIGQALQVAYVLEGTVRRMGGKIRMTAQLIDTRTEVEKWAEKYERDLSDLFAIQNQISEAIVAQLKATLSPAEKAAIETPPTQDLQAYDMYLRARAFVNAIGILPRVREENWPTARKLLEDAIARDPKFVLAYCLLSQVLSTPNWAERLTPEQIAQGKAAAETAVRLAPDSGDAHLALGDIYYGVLNDRDRGIEEYKIAARTMPNSPIVQWALGDVAVDRGEWKKGLEHLQKAAQLDPRDPDVALRLIQFYTELRWHNEAELLIDRTIATLPPETTRSFWDEKSDIAIARGDLKAARSALEASPGRNIGSASHNHRIARLLILEHRYAEAVDLIDRIPEIAGKANALPRSGINPFARGAYALTKGHAYRTQGEMEKARAAFEESRKGFADWLLEHPEEPEALGMIAVADAGLGHKEEALLEAQKGMQTWPLSREPLNAANLRNYVAIVYAWTGNLDAAIRLLQEQVRLPGGPSSGDLKLHPKWNELRSDPRFAEVVREAAKPVTIH